MDYLSIKERAGWLSDMITSEIQRFESATGVQVDDLRVHRIDGRMTSVGVDIYRSLENDRA